MPPGTEGGLQEEPVGRTEPIATVWYKPLKLRLPLGSVLQGHSLLVVSRDWKTKTKEHLVMKMTLILLRSFQFLGVP